MFTFELVHIPGTKHVGPDALSRRPLADDETAIEDDDSWLDNIALLATDARLAAQLNPNHAPCALPLPSAFCFASRKSEEDMLSQIETFLDTLITPVFSTPQKKRRFMAKAMEFFLKDKILYKRNGSYTPLLVLRTAASKLSVLEQAHEKLGHKGVQAVFELLRHRFYWPHLRADVHHHVRSCHECQIRSVKRMETPLNVSTPLALFQKVYVDVMHMHEARGYNYIVAARDDLSGASEVRALRAATSKELARFFSEQLIFRYGTPVKVITDNGPETKAAFKQLMERLGIPHISFTPYNHHTNGVVEQGYATLREALIKTCEGHINDWPDHLQAAAFADRITISRVTGYFPYQLLYGTDPMLPMDLAEATFIVTSFHSKMTTTKLLALRIRQLQKCPTDIAAAAETLRKS